MFQVRFRKLPADCNFLGPFQSLVVMTKMDRRLERLWSKANFALKARMDCCKSLNQIHCLPNHFQCPFIAT
jgi:hypothetical protein